MGSNGLELENNLFVSTTTTGGIGVKRYEPLTSGIWDLDHIHGIIHHTGKKEEKKLPERYILNKDACICFWKDKSKTISKRHEKDEFDKELGFLFACWQHYNEDKSKNLRKKILGCIKYDHMKELLFERFRAENKMTVEQARRYLKDLKVEESKKIEKQVKKVVAKHMKKEEAQ